MLAEQGVWVGVRVKAHPETRSTSRQDTNIRRATVIHLNRWLKTHHHKMPIIGKAGLIFHAVHLPSAITRVDSYSVLSKDTGQPCTAELR
jgi:hypothetical protein